MPEDEKSCRLFEASSATNPGGFAGVMHSSLVEERTRLGTLTVPKRHIGVNVGLVLKCAPWTITGTPPSAGARYGVTPAITTDS